MVKGPLQQKPQSLTSMPLNWPLVGQPAARRHIDTPALILDLDVLESNIAAMAKIASSRSISLRPHGKTHKCSQIATRQMEAGAVGICCSKVSEAEAFANNGIGSITVTSPVSDPTKLNRLLSLRDRVRDLALVMDQPLAAEAVSAVAKSLDSPLRVIVDIDVGQHRTGVTSVDEAIDLGRLVDSLPGLELIGIQGYAGHLQHVVEYDERLRLSAAVLATLKNVRDGFLSHGLTCDVVTGSGTGTHDIDSQSRVFTELQVGSYIFMDSHYDEVDLARDVSHRFGTSLFVATQVISNNQTGFVTTDAGSKSFALDGRPPRIARGAPTGSTYAPFGDQFGRLDLPKGSTHLSLGTRVEFVTPHCDPTVNLYKEFHCVRGDAIEAIWPIANGATS